jgi:hypothetical protein
VPVPLRTLTALVPYQVEQTIKDLVDHGTGLETTLGALGAKVAAIPAPLTLAAIRTALSATGSTPLNIQSLIPSSGGTAVSRAVVSGGALILDVFANRPPVAGIPQGALFVASDRGYQTWILTGGVWQLLPGWGGPMIGNVFAPNQRPGLGPNDIGFRFQGADANDAIWQWNGNAFFYVVGTGFPIEVTLNPSTLPTTLTINDAGFPIWAYDYHRLYIWNGVGWTEGQHNDSRYMVVEFGIIFFGSGGTPDQNGWFPCNGTVVQRSTSAATVTPITTPTLAPGNYIRL